MQFGSVAHNTIGEKRITRLFPLISTSLIYHILHETYNVILNHTLSGHCRGRMCRERPSRTHRRSDISDSVHSPSFSSDSESSTRPKCTCFSARGSASHRAMMAEAMNDDTGSSYGRIILRLLSRGQSSKSPFLCCCCRLCAPNAALKMSVRMPITSSESREGRAAKTLDQILIPYRNVERKRRKLGAHASEEG